MMPRQCMRRRAGTQGELLSLSTDNRNVPLFKTLEMSPFVVVVHFYFPVVVEAVRKVEIRVVCGFPSAVGKSVLWTFPRSGFSTAFRRWASRDCSSAAANLLLPRLSGGLSFTTSIGRSGRRNHSDGRRHRDRWFAPRAHLAIALPPGMIRCLGSGRLGLLGRGLASSYGLNWNRAGNLFPSHRPTAIANL